VGPAGADLGLADDLAGPVLGGFGRGLVRVCLELRTGQTERIVGSLVLVADGHGQAVMVALPAQAGIGELAVGAALWAEAVDRQARQAGRKVKPVLQRRGERHPALAQSEAAGVQPDLELPLAHRLREQRDHAARGVAVQRRERPAQHLDPLGPGEVEMRDLALAIGHGGGDAVRVQAQAAHAETGTGAEAAGADLQVLRVVVAVGHHQPRHAGQGLGQIDHRSAVAQRLGADRGDGIGHLGQLARAGRAGDDDRFQRGIGCRLSQGSALQAGQQAGEGGDRGRAQAGVAMAVQRDFGVMDSSGSGSGQAL